MIFFKLFKIHFHMFKFEHTCGADISAGVLAAGILDGRISSLLGMLGLLCPVGALRTDF